MWVEHGLDDVRQHAELVRHDGGTCAAKIVQTPWGYRLCLGGLGFASERAAALEDAIVEPARRRGQS